MAAEEPRDEAGARHRGWWLAAGLLALLLVLGLAALWVQTPALYGAGDAAKTATATTRSGILTVAAALIAATAAGAGLYVTARTIRVNQQALAETQRANRASEERALRAERSDAFVAFLASARRYRRFLMYSDVPFEVVNPTPQSKGTVLFKGRDRYDAAVDKAYARLLIVTDSPDIVEAVASLTDRLNHFVREHAEYGKGNIPNESVSDFLEAEQDFAARAHRALGAPLRATLLQQPDAKPPHDATVPHP